MLLGSVGLTVWPSLMSLMWSVRMSLIRSPSCCWANSYMDVVVESLEWP